MPTEELNYILLHDVANGWAKQAFLHVWDFEIKTCRATCAMFERMEISEQFYEVQTPSKTIPRSDTNCYSYVRKRKGVEAALPINL